MKIIDLLNKIANGEEVPEKIKFNDYEYLYHDKEHGYCRNDYDCTYICLDSEYYLFDILNDEVEILEEEKKIPEKLEDRARFQYSQIPSWFREKELIDTINENFEKHQKAIYELIDYLKSKGDE